MMRMFRAALGTNNIDHCTRLCHSTSVAAMQRALNTSAASGSMREVEHAADVIFIAGANTTESRSEEHTSELQSPCNLVCRLLLEKKKNKFTQELTLTLSAI